MGPTPTISSRESVTDKVVEAQRQHVVARLPRSNRQAVGEESKHRFVPFLGLALIHI